MQDLKVEKEYAEIMEVKGLDEPNENCIRVYCTQVNQVGEPDSFNLQVRTHGSLSGRYSKGVKRDMIATVNVTIPELEAILDYMRACEAQHTGR